jgi:hypothetical protein
VGSNVPAATTPQPCAVARAAAAVPEAEAQADRNIDADLDVTSAADLATWALRCADMSYTSQATHKRQMDRYRTTGNADRASFTRLTALRSSGTWYGRDPVATARAHGPDESGS